MLSSSLFQNLHTAAVLERLENSTFCVCVILVVLVLIVLLKIHQHRLCMDSYSVL